MMKLGCFLTLITVALLWGGGQALYIAVTNRNPTELTCGDYLRTKPSATWVKMTNARIFLTEAMYKESIGRVEELYIPVRPANGDGSETCRILLATRDPELIAANERLRALESRPGKLTEADIEGFIRLREIQGLVRFGVDLNDKERKKLASLGGNLTPDFVIIDEGKKPDLLKGAGLFAGGLVLSAFLVWRLLKPRAASTIPIASSGNPPPTPPAPGA